MKSRTIQYLPDGSIDLIEKEIGDPKDNEIQVAGEICGVCSWDVVTCKLGSKFKHPAPPGHEGIGRVLKVGRDVKGIQEGDLVTGNGFSTVQNMTTQWAYKLPPSKLAPEHWLVEPVSCVITGLDHCRLQAGQRVAVVGCGFMGLLLLQGLVRSFADQVVAIDIDDKRLALAASLGIKETYNSATADMDQVVKDLQAREIDTVVDTSGTQQGLDLSSKIVKNAGLINLFGWIKGEAATFDPSTWHIKGVTVVNSSPTARMREVFPIAIRLIHSGVFDLRPLVTHVVPLEGYPDLMRNTILAGDKSYVKGVVKLS